MPVTFQAYEALSESPLKEIAERYLLGKTFESIDEALSQKVGSERLSGYFKPSPQTSQSDLVGIALDEDNTVLHNQPGFASPLVKAKFLN